MTAPGYAAVIGGVNIDVCGRPAAPLIPRDSNPGAVSTSLGGVGRNIAHNMALLGLPVKLLTALGDDHNAQRVEASCAALSIDLSHTLRVPGGVTSTYLFITDHRGEMELAVSDMTIYDALTPDWFAARMEVLNAARLVVLDTNIPGSSIRYIADHCTAPLFVDPVSVSKAEKLRPILSRIHTLKPNRLETALLSGVEVTDEDSLRRAAQVLLDRGVERVFLSLGADGLLAADRSGLCRVGVTPGEMVNTTGCGDAFMAALAWSWWEGLSLRDSARAGSAAAAIALASPETISPAMSPAGVRRLMALHDTL